MARKAEGRLRYDEASDSFVYEIRNGGGEEYTYNELAGQWERVVGADVVEDTYKETRDFEHFEI